jgi:hypothetical protein
MDTDKHRFLTTKVLADGHQTRIDANFNWNFTTDFTDFTDFWNKAGGIQRNDAKRQGRKGGHGFF